MPLGGYSADMATGNLFLDSLTPLERAPFGGRLERVTLKQGTLLAGPRLAAAYAYFPIDGVISTVAIMRNGDAIEVGFFGRDGFSPTAFAFGSPRTPHTSIVQLTGDIYRMAAADYHQIYEHSPALALRARAFAEYAYTSAAQFAACNRLHPVESRYARWLLMASDRVGGREFLLTQEFAAEMLGVRRASVTLVAGTLAGNGAISYRRGRTKVLDHAKLESMACECYGVINAELKYTMGYSIKNDAGAVERSA